MPDKEPIPGKGDPSTESIPKPPKQEDSPDERPEDRGDADNNREIKSDASDNDHGTAEQTTELPATINITTTSTPQPPQQGHFETLTASQRRSAISTMNQVDRTSAVLAELRKCPSTAAVEDDKLIQIIQVAQYDADRAVDIYKLWCRLGSPPVDAEVEQEKVWSKDLQNDMDEEFLSSANEREQEERGVQEAKIDPPWKAASVLDVPSKRR
ncbi:hypothetical protein PMZ80_007752 [Knufia obscura]|uniref:Uncharacterized protein n=2 Tax=Knufia TaxID=430999 RepID=A0AAN8EUW7_9EURO|nr:hypothetical protein PMZ80_007752 [Knufia obscura]KAK5954286.1 hypothetical protein OHC33_004859 [Knufia fluminis]